MELREENPDRRSELPDLKEPTDNHEHDAIPLKDQAG